MSESNNSSEKEIIQQNNYSTYVSVATVVTAFCWGLYNSTNSRKNFITSPLSTLFNGVITGSLYSLGAGIVQIFIPPPVQFIVPVFTTLALAKHIKDDIYPPVVSNGNKPVEQNTKDKKLEPSIASNADQKEPLVDNNKSVELSVDNNKSVELSVDNKTEPSVDNNEPEELSDNNK